MASSPFFLYLLPSDLQSFWFVSRSPLSKTKLPIQVLYKCQHTLKKNLDNKLVANIQTNLYLFLPWGLGCWPSWPDCGLLRINAKAQTRHSVGLNAEKGAFGTNVCCDSTVSHPPLLSLRLRLCLWLHFRLKFKIIFMTNYQKFTPKSSLSSFPIQSTNCFN